MGRLSAFFVAICMVLIACSIGAVLYLRFGLSGAESALLALTALTALALVNAVSARLNDRRNFDTKVQELARGSAELSRHVAELGRRVAAIDGNAQAAVETTLAATQPISEEIGEVGGLIKQIAEAVAAHDTQLKGLGTTAPVAIPEATVVPIPAIPSMSLNPSLSPNPIQEPTPGSIATLVEGIAGMPDAGVSEVPLAPQAGGGADRRPGRPNPGKPCLRKSNRRRSNRLSPPRHPRCPTRSLPSSSPPSRCRPPAASASGNSRTMEPAASVWSSR